MRSASGSELGCLAVLLCAGCASEVRQARHESLMQQLAQRPEPEAVWRERFTRIHKLTSSKGPELEVRERVPGAFVVTSSRVVSPEPEQTSGRVEPLTDAPTPTPTLDVTEHAVLRLTPVDGGVVFSCDDGWPGSCEHFLGQMLDDFPAMQAQATRDAEVRAPQRRDERDLAFEAAEREFVPYVGPTFGIGFDVGVGVARGAGEVVGGAFLRGGARLYRSSFWGVAVTGQAGIFTVPNVGLAAQLSIPVRLELHQFAPGKRSFAPRLSAYGFVAPLMLARGDGLGGGFRLGIGGALTAIPSFGELSFEQSWFGRESIAGVRFSIGFGF